MLEIVMNRIEKVIVPFYNLMSCLFLVCCVLFLPSHLRGSILLLVETSAVTRIVRYETSLL